MPLDLKECTTNYGKNKISMTRSTEIYLHESRDPLEPCDARTAFPVARVSKRADSNREDSISPLVDPCAELHAVS